MPQIKDLSATGATDIVDLTQVQIAVQHLGISPQTRKISMFEFHTELTEVRTLSMSTSQILTGTITEIIAARPTNTSLTLTVPTSKSAIVFNAGPETLTVSTTAGATAVAVGEWLHVHWTGSAHVVTGPVGGTGAGQTDLTQTRNVGTYTILSSTGTDVNLAQFDHIGPGILPSTTTMTISPPTGPPTEFNEYLWGFTHSTTGAVKAFKYDYEFALTSHGLTTATDRGKPIVVRPNSSTPAAVLNDTSTTQFPTGILKRADATRIVFCSPGDIIRVPTLLLEDGNSYSIDTKGRFLFWDQNASAGRSWRSTKPLDSNPALPDLLEVLRVNQFGDSTFEARVRDFGPTTLLSGTFQPVGQIDTSSNSTPDVSNVAVVMTAGATITNFLNGVIGQRITVFANDASTIVHNNLLVQNLSGSNLTLNTGQRAQYQFINNIWRQL